MGNVLNLLSEETFAEKMDTKNFLLAAIASQNGGIAITSWADVQKLVRMGLASKVFTIGDQLTCQRGSATLAWDVIGIDHDTPTDKTKEHSLTLQLHDCAASLQFDEREAFYYSADGLTAGIYNFTVGEQKYFEPDVGKTFQFTLTQPVPAGGQIVFKGSLQATLEGTNISTYAGGSSTTEIETVQLTSGSSGTNLGTMNNTINGALNSSQRALIGNGNYAQSALRQYLNSSAAAGSVWTPKNNFDRPPTWAMTTAGFLNGMDEDFLAAVGYVDKITALNTISDGGGSVTTSEKFFLLSRSEVYGGNENDVEEGSAYPYYSGNSDLSKPGMGEDTNRIKYQNGTAKYWWIRSPVTRYAFAIREVYPTGLVGTYGNSTSIHEVVPACCIV